MNRDEALTVLLSGNDRERLEAARVLEREATPDDVELLRNVRSGDNSRWIDDALGSALKRLLGKDYEDTRWIEPSAADIEEWERIPLEALDRAARILLHEIRPVIGAARAFAQTELEHYEATRTWEELNRLVDVIALVEALQDAAEPPELSEMPIRDLVKRALDSLLQQTKVPIRTAGDGSLKVIGVRSMLGAAIQNALKNAVEATEDFDHVDRHPITIRWGQTDVDTYVSVIDRGKGLPEDDARIFRLSSSTKAGHAGLGLAISYFAAKQMGGKIRMARREGGGTIWQLRWPRDAD